MRPAYEPKSITAVHIHNCSDETYNAVKKSLQNARRTEAIPQDTIQVRNSDNKIVINGIVANVRSYRIIVPNKVIETTFTDGSKEKVVLHHGDVFDLDTGIRICIAKHVGREYYNLAGIENLAERLSYLKCIDKMIDKLHRQKKKEEKAKKKAEEIAAENKARAEKKRKKAEEKRRMRHYYAESAEEDCRDSTLYDPDSVDGDYGENKHQLDPLEVIDNPTRSSRSSRLNIRAEKHHKDDYNPPRKRRDREKRK